MEETYSITLTQVEQIEDLASMFELNAVLISDLCKAETSGILLGFELGKIHSNLKFCQSQMQELEFEIKNSDILKS